MQDEKVQLLIFIHNHSKQDLENEAWTINIHTTLASFSFNFDHVHPLILNDYKWFWMHEKAQFCYMWMNKIEKSKVKKYTTENRNRSEIKVKSLKISLITR